MAFKKQTPAVSAPESPDRLFRDLPRRKYASLFDHQGQVLRAYAAEGLEVPDIALQLPTGSGKTLVGLLLAEWRRRKYRERVVFLCPTRQLVNQVSDEARNKYGIMVEPFTGPKAEYSPASRATYSDSERVAVTTYSSLFNTNPYFKNPNIVILDDAHAAENYIAELWALRIDRQLEADRVLFNAVVGVLKRILPRVNHARMTGSWSDPSDAHWVDKVPTNVLAQISDELHAAISENVKECPQRFQWRMLSDHIGACQLYVSSSEILLRPMIPPTWTHEPYANATQRIFMSATLGAGGDLERMTGRRTIKRLPIPEGWDKQGIGRRFFMFPERSLASDSIRDLRLSLMKRAGRSLVLTPSNEAAKAILTDLESVTDCQVFRGADLEESKTAFISATFAVAVVANRYDGIDLPDDQCRLLFVEGLPRATNLQERFLMQRMGAGQLFNERVQARVLQAIGRCTRGLNDYSAVVAIGDDLSGYLGDRGRRQHFHPELQAELEFGTEQSTRVEQRDFEENFDVFLEHDTEWESVNNGILESRAAAVQTPFAAMSDLERTVAHEIEWQSAMWSEDYVQAHESARAVLGVLEHCDLRGYRALWHYLAGSAAGRAAATGNKSFEVLSREQFRKAKSAAGGIPWLVALAAPQPDEPDSGSSNNNATMLQVEQLERYLKDLGTVHDRDFARRERDIRTGLEDGARFEIAHLQLGQHLGFSAGKIESDGSPDPWWIIGETAFVFEDHANADPRTAVIDVTKARQAASHPAWLKDRLQLSPECTVLAVLVTPARSARAAALPILQAVAYWELSDFRTWAGIALETIRQLRSDFTEPGDLEWRSRAASKLQASKLDATGLLAWLKTQMASGRLQRRG